MIIGLTGSYAAGKDTIANYLVKRGFVYHSLSDILRGELNKRNQPITRENLILVGNEIRTGFGAGELAKRALDIIHEDHETNSLVVSVRNPEEVKVLKSASDFQMWYVDAPIETRYERTVKRKRSDDFASFEDFMAKEKMENTTDPNAQQLNLVAQMADVEIINDKDLEFLYKTVDELLKEDAHSLNREESA